MAKYEPGDYVKAEFKDESTGENEWMWGERYVNRILRKMVVA